MSKKVFFNDWVIECDIDLNVIKDRENVKFLSESNDLLFNINYKDNLLNFERFNNKTIINIRDEDKKILIS